MEDLIRKSFSDAAETLNMFVNKCNVDTIVLISNLIADCFENGGKIIICGNGGSNCDAIHFAEEFTGRFRKDRPPLPVIAISDSSHITCVANDYGFEEVFSRGVAAFGDSGDILIAISTSGNSENIIRAVRQAEMDGLITIGLLGRDGGKMKGMCDHELIVQGVTTDRIQEIHMTILHIIIEMTERILFPETYA